MILSTVYENLILDLLRGGSIPAISNFYLGLIKTSDGNEVVGNSYSRIVLPANLITWKSTQGSINEISNGASGEIINAVPLSWGTALETWGTVDKIRFYTTLNGADYFCDVNIPQAIITSGTEVMISAGDFKISTRNE
jgi:hypothetical protein